MFKSFLAKSLDDLKRLGNWLKENIRFFFAVFPVLTPLSLMVLFFYAIWKVSLLMSWSNKFNNISNSINNTINSIDNIIFNVIWYCLAAILEFVFNAFDLIAIILGLIVVGAISNFFHKRKMKKRLLIVGIPNKDNVTVLLALFNLRCREIGRLYFIVGNLQKKANKNSWIESFLVEVLNDHNLDGQPYVYDDSKEKKIDAQKQKNREDAIKLLKEKFNFSEWWHSMHENNSSHQDLMTAFKLDYQIHDIHRLGGLLIFGQFQNTIHALLNEYIKFYSNPSILFIYDKPLLGYLKNRAHESQKTIDIIWEEIIGALKYSLIFLKMKNDESFNTDKLLKEIEALRSLQDKNAIYAILERKNNFDEKSWKTPDKEKENLILSKMKNNPLNDL